jgi:two-component system nitrogen regulation sensor histidine kinase NtrY
MAKALSTKAKIGLASILAVLGVVTFALIVQWRSEEELFVGNILIFSLININILALLVLVVLVARNLIKLLFERKRGILGSKLRSRLMGSFVLISLIPMTLSFLVASGLINQAVQGWFNTQIDSIVGSSLTMARQYVANAKASVQASSDRVNAELRKRTQALPSEKELDTLRHLNELYSIKVVGPSGAMLVASSHATAEVESFAEPPLAESALKASRTEGTQLRVEERGASQFIRVYQPLGAVTVVSSYRMDPEMVHAQGVVNEAFSEYEELKGFKDPLKTNFFLILALSNLLTLFGAIWVAFFISKQITGPIQVLAEGTRSVARGDYDFALQSARDDEIGYLVTSFNQMLGDLKVTRNEADRRGSLIQAIVSNLGVGVIALDPERRVTVVNTAAAQLLEIEGKEASASGLALEGLLQPEHYAELAPVIDSLALLDSRGQHEAAVEREVRLRSGGRELIVVCTAGRITTSEASSLGYVLLLDDVTELSRSQHLAAWRDVARRIAHEIKNPLTPLQLSAQRLDKLLHGHEVGENVRESTRSIVEHVEIIKRLANEFSEYGRMPTAQFVPTDLETLLRNLITSHRADHPDIEFCYHVAERVPEMLLDPEQMRGVFINILANAVAAVRLPASPHSEQRIDVVMRFDRTLSRVTVEVADSGPGIPAEDKNRVFEPYFTTKKGGTGLGLAIVSSVISDHQGEIRLFDNKPHGTRFVLSLPQHPQATTVRRISAAAGGEAL